jgi:acetyltransferase
MLNAARPTSLRIIGPNCLGLWCRRLGSTPISAWRIRRPQSGALVGGVLDWAESRGIGFSYVVSMGDMADVGDLLDFLAADANRKARA